MEGRVWYRRGAVRRVLSTGSRSARGRRSAPLTTDVPGLPDGWAISTTDGTAYNSARITDRGFENIPAVGCRKYVEFRPRRLTLVLISGQEPVKGEQKSVQLVSGCRAAKVDPTTRDRRLRL